MHPHVLYNDRILKSDQKILTPGQLGLLAGWGVFTTLRIYDGIPFEFERHWQRMAHDADIVHVRMRWDAREMRERIGRLVEANKARNATMRVCVVRSQGGFWEGPGSGNESDLIAFSTDLAKWQESVALGVAEQGRHAGSRFAGTKTLSWSHNLTLLEEANQKGFAEVILLNERGEVAECTSTNIFATQDGVTYTPPLASGCLPGVTRAVMLERLNLEDARVAEKTLGLEDLYDADEVFITSTTRELLPVHQILEHPLSKGQSSGWPVMHGLHAALTEYIQDYVEEAKRKAVA